MSARTRGIQIDTSHIDDIIDHLKRIAEPPSRKTVAALDAVLDAAFADTQERVDVISGSLKASGRVSSEVGVEEWTGRISYGGVSAGPNPVVDYALYELQRGGSHDFLAGLPVFDGKFERAMNDHFDA